MLHNHNVNMIFPTLHPWNVTPPEARAIQNDLAAGVIPRNEFGKIETIAGADIALDPETNTGYAGVVVYDVHGLQEIERASAAALIEFPYIPGLLAFREGPVLLKAFEKLKTRPDLVMFDGQGLAHPRRLGIASHMGLWLDCPTIGVAKKVLVGKYREPDWTAGSQTPLTDKNETIGMCVRSRTRVKPIFVSIGHKIDLPTAVKFTLSCLDGTRIPKPTREADHFVEQIKDRARGSAWR